MGEAFDLMFATMQGEIDKLFTKDVKPAEKTAFDAEMKAMRESVRQNRISVDRLQPVLRTLRDVVSDERVTPEERREPWDPRRRQVGTRDRVTQRSGRRLTIFNELLR